MITLTVPHASPSLNAFYGKHWTKKLKAFKEWRRWIWALKQENKRAVAELEGKRHVTIERYGGRILDHDNFVGGLKSVIDALVAEGFLVDDSPAHVSIDYRQFLGMPHKTIIRIQGEQEWRLSTKTPPASSGQATERNSSSSKNAIQTADALL